LPVDVDIAEYNMADQLPTFHVFYPVQFSSDIGTLDDFSVAFLSVRGIASCYPQIPGGPPQSERE
jgi:hypothetical protein